MWALELSWAKWLSFRFVFFGLLAVDAFLQLPHASRYGAGGFNVAHVSAVPLPEPGRASITFVHGALCILFALVAQGALVRVALPLATALYGWAYFSSQLDSYQHHYLVWLLLVVLCFAPRAPDSLPAGAGPSATRRVTSWAFRLALIQVGIVYAWAAISKIDTLWLDGSALYIQIQDGWVRSLVGSIGFERVAVMVMGVELFLAAAVWIRPLRVPAIVAGVGLHVGVELIGLEIGLFSYLMIAVYLLLVPDLLYTATAAQITPLLGRLGRRLPIAALAHAGWPIAIALLVAAVVVIPLPFGGVVAVAVVLLLAGTVAALLSPARGRRGRLAWAFALAAAVPIVVNARTDVASDYYRYWAGSARRLGDDADARRAYLGLLEVEPGSEYAHYYLGKLDSDAGRLDAAIDHYRRAQRGDPTRARAFFAEADVRLRQNDRELARAALEAGLRIEPANAQAQGQLTSLGGTRPSPGAGRVEARVTGDDD